MSDPLKMQIRKYAACLAERQHAAGRAAVQERASVEQSARSSDPVVEETPELWPGFEDYDDDSPDSLWTRLKRPLGAAALGFAVAVPVAVALFLILSSSDTGPDLNAGGAGAPVAAQPSAPVAFSAEGALVVSESYFEAFNDHDVEGVSVLFAEDATYADNWTETSGREYWESEFAWDIAQGGTQPDAECVVREESSEEVRITCEHVTHDAITTAVGSAGIVTVTRFVVTPAGISEIDARYGPGVDFATTGIPFQDWMDENHPDDAEVAGCCGGETVEESVVRGEARAEFAQLYLEHLDETVRQN